MFGRKTDTENRRREREAAGGRLRSIPLRNRLEALVLAAVTILASASVDWSSLLAKAEDGNGKSLNASFETVDANNPVITAEVVGKGGDGQTKPYDEITSAFMNVCVSAGGEADYIVDVYQNYKEGEAYTTGVKNGNRANGQAGNGTVYGTDGTTYSAERLWGSNSSSMPIDLANGERATIVVTFTYVTAGTSIQYGKDADGNAIETTRTSKATFDDATLTGNVSSYVTTVGGDQIDMKTYGQFSLNPAYDRPIDLGLYNGALDADGDGTISSSEWSAITTSNPLVNSTSQASIDKTKWLLQPGSASGVNTLVVSAGTSQDKWLAIPIRVVDPGVGTSYDNLTWTGTQVTEPSPSCGANKALSKNATDVDGCTISYAGESLSGHKYTTATASEITEAGTYTISIVGHGIYAGLNYTKEFTIAAKNIADSTVQASADKKFTINPENLEVTGSDGAVTDSATNKPLVPGTDYKVDSVTRTDTGFAVKVTGIGNYQGTQTFTNTDTTKTKVDISVMVKGLTLYKLDSTGAEVPAVFDFDGTGHELDQSGANNTPGFKFTDKNGSPISLTLGTDYAYSLTSDKSGNVVYDSATKASTNSTGAIEAGTYTVSIRGLGNYTGQIYSTQFGQTFKINPRQLTANNIIVSMNPTEFVDNGKQQNPTTVTVYYPYGEDADNNGVRDKKWPMTEGTDYTVTYPTSVSAGNYAIKLTGMNNFSGEMDFSNLQKAAAGTSVADLDKKPDEVHPQSTVSYKIIPSLDAAEISIGDNSGKLDYSTKKDDEWKTSYETPYTGKEHKPAVEVKIGQQKLTAYVSDGTTTNEDVAQYRVSYDTENTTNAGEASLIISGMGVYKGQADIEVKYTITPKELATGALTLNDGVSHEYKVGSQAVTLSSNEYSVKDSTSTSDLKEAPVKTADLEEDEATIAERYKGYDYYLTYTDNEDAGDATVTAHGINNYSGSSSGSFKITKKEFQKGTFSIDPIPKQSYTGVAVEPDKNDPDQVIVRYNNKTILKKGTDYTLTYEDNIEVSDKAKVTVTGTGNYKGTLTATFEILNKSLVDTNVTYIIAGERERVLGPETNSGYRVEYTGEKQHPSVVLKSGNSTLTRDKDYSLDYDTSNDNIEVGQATIKISGKGSYKGSNAVLTYKIVEKDINAISGLKLVSLPKSDVDQIKTAGTDTSSILTTGTEVKRYYQVQNGSGKAFDANTADGKKNYIWTWTDPDGKTLSEGEVPAVAGSGWSLVLTGQGNYKNSTSAITADSTGKPLAVGASLDVNEIVDAAEKSGSDPNVTVPFLGTNMPVVTVDASKLTSKGSDKGDVHGYNTNVAFAFTKADNTVNTTAKLVGPAYTGGQYVNGQEGQDYTIEYVDENGNALTSLPVGTSFRIRISAVAGSSRFFGSHTILNARRVAACDLSALAGRSKVTVSDVKATESYRNYKKDAADTTTTKLTYAFTGSPITPALKPKFVPQAKSTYTTTAVVDGTKDSFAPIDLTTYGFTYDTKNSDNNQVLAAAVNSNGTITLTGDGTNFTSSTDISYEITSHPVEKSDIKLDATKLNYTYDGTSHKDDITGAVSVVSLNQTLTPGDDYKVEFHKQADCADTAIDVDNPNGAFTNAGEIYVMIKPGTGTNSNFKIESTGLIADTHFTIGKKDLSGVTLVPKYDTDTMGQQENVYALQYKSTLDKEKLGADVTDGKTTLTETTDYTVVKKDIVLGANTLEIKASDTGNYTGSKTVTFYVYGTLSDGAVDNRFVTTDLVSDTTTFTLNAAGKPANKKGEVFDPRSVKFAIANDASGNVLSGDDLDISIIDPDNNIVTDLNTPGKKKITFRGKGVAQKCEVKSQSFIVKVYGDLQNATIEGLATDYDFKGENKEPVDKSKLSLKLNGVPVPTTAYKITVHPKEGSTTYAPLTGTRDDGYVKVEKADTTNDVYYKLSGDASSKIQHFNIRYNLKGAEIDTSELTDPKMDDKLEDIKGKIKVKIAEKELAVDTDYTLQVIWGDTGSSQTTGKVKLNITIKPVDEVSYNSKTIKINGSKKQLTSTMITWPTTTEATYNGEDHRQDFSDITVTGTNSSGESEELVLGTDYTITWTKGTGSAATSISDSTPMIDADTYTATISGEGNYYTATDITKPFVIKPKSISGLTMTSSNENAKYYTGEQPEVTFTLRDDETGKDLVPGTDYDLVSVVTQNSATDPWNVGTKVKYTATGKGNYDSATSTSYDLEIEAADISQSGIVDIPDKKVTYNGKEQKPTFTVNRVDNAGNTIKTLTKDVDYTDNSELSGQDFINAGTHPCKIVGKGKYKGELNFTYEIEKKDISTANVTLDKADKIYDYANGAEVKPTIKSATIQLGTNSTDTSLTNLTDSDYDLSYANNKTAHAMDGTNPPTVTLTGKGNYTGTKSLTFQIGKSLDDATVKMVLTDNTSREYDGTTFRPTVKSLKYGATALTEGVDFETSYTDADEHALSDGQPTEVGTYHVVATGKGGYFGTKSEPYTITSQAVDKGHITITLPEQEWYYAGGEEIRPKPTAVVYTDDDGNEKTLTPDTDYEASWENNKEAGTNARVRITLKGNYKNAAKNLFAKFTILPVDLTDFELAPGADWSDKVDWTGKAITQGFVLSGTNGNGDTISVESADGSLDGLSDKGLVGKWSANTDPGTAVLTVQGDGVNFTGDTKSLEFKIVGNLAKATVTTTDALYNNGKETHPSITVAFGSKTLTEGTDYTVEYDSDDWANGGTGWATIRPVSGSEYYKGTKTVSFKITDTITDTNLIITGYDGTTFYYNGSAQTPALATSTNPTGLRVAYWNGTTESALPSGAITTFHYNGTTAANGAVNAGTVTITATVTLPTGSTVNVSKGTGGATSATYRIYPVNIASCTISEANRATYTSQPVQPVVSVSTSAGIPVSSSNYTVTYSNNVNPGRASYTVTGRNNFTGSTTKHFSIIVPKVTNVKASVASSSSVTLTWKRQAILTGYRVVYGSSGTTAGWTTDKTYTITGLSNPANTTVGVQAYVTAGGTTTYGAVTEVLPGGGTVQSKSVAAAPSSENNVTTAEPKSSGSGILAIFKKVAAKLTGKADAEETEKTAATRVAAADAVETETVSSTEAQPKTLTGKLTWKKIDGADGYVIYRSRTADGTFRQIGSVRQGTYSYKDPFAASGKTYYYKVAAYTKDANGKRTVGAQSAAVAVTKQ